MKTPIENWLEWLHYVTGACYALGIIIDAKMEAQVKEMYDAGITPEGAAIKIYQDLQKQKL